MPVPVTSFIFANRVNFSDMTKEGVFTAANGNFLGTLYVRYVDDSLISDLHIVGESNKLLFKMDRNGIFNLMDGTNLDINRKGFYGYKIIKRTSDRIVVGILLNGGEDVGDSTTLYWDYSKGMFKLLQPPF